MDEIAVDHHLDFITTISRISTRFIGSLDLDDSIDAALADIGKLTKADRAYLFLLRDQRSKMDNTNEWCAQGVTPQKANLQDLPTEDFPWWMKKLSRKERIHIEDVSQLPEEAKAEREILEKQEIKSLLVFPIFSEANLIGFVGFDNIQTPGRWPDMAFMLLNIASKIIANAVKRRSIEGALKESEEKLSRMFKHVNDAISVTDLDAQIVETNERSVEQFGYGSKNEIVGRSAFEFIAAKDHQRAKDNMKRTQVQGSVKGLEYTLIRKDGSEFIGELNVSVLKDSSDRVVGFIAVTRDITERKRMEEELKTLATTDPLTGSLNRRSGLLLFAKNLKMVKRNNQKLCICYVDVDSLKEINDTYGHREGDEALKVISNFFKETLREADILCRIGGDEFLLILPRCSIDQASQVWNRFSKKLRTFNERKTKPYMINLSHGFAEYDPADEKTVDQLITIADQAMYEEKTSDKK